MPKIILLRWLPASWKSTFAGAQEWAIIFNKDTLRQKYPELDEDKIIKMERELVETWMGKECPLIIVDNTHLDKKDWTENKHISFYKELAEKYNYDVEIKQFPVSLEVAILRDKIRWLEGWRSVGEKVIRNFSRTCKVPLGHKENPVFKPYKEELDDAIIVDIDWTLAFMDWKRSPYDYTKVWWDRFNKYLDLLIGKIDEWYAYNENELKIFVVSGRKDDCKNETIEWLDKNNFVYDKLYMRKANDERSDDVVKEEIYNEFIKDKYNVIAVFDDRDKVCSMWWDIWLPCYKVYHWNF